jgi:hypothetical protein
MSESNTTPWLNQDLAPLHVIRTETVLSRLPIHNLSKTGAFDIQITRRDDNGQVQLRWEVSYSSRYGPPRQLAYKLDTLLINRRLDSLPRPLQSIVPLGSLRDMARELDLGGDTNSIRRALRQNAFTAIAARVTYRASNGSERRIEADFTRYSVIFAGEKLPDGRAADCVYLILNEPYLEVLNNAPMRPLNYDYLKALAPAPQRFYEIVSYKMFAALKYHHAEARLPYSEFCTFSAVQRYPDYDHFKKQMYKVHKPHLDAGYLAKVRYQATVDEEGNPDWTMFYQPGPRAEAEFAAFERKRAPGANSDAEKRLLVPPEPVAEPAETWESAEPVAGGRPGTLFDQMRRRGITEAQARKLLAAARPDQPIAEQLAWGDRLIQESRNRIYNPPGFYVYLIRECVLPPAAFLAARPAPESPASEALDFSGELTAAPPNLERHAAYEEYKREEIEHYLAARYTPEQYRALVKEKEREIKKQYRSASTWPAENLRDVAEGALRTSVAGEVALAPFDEWNGRG